MVITLPGCTSHDCLSVLVKNFVTGTLFVCCFSIHLSIIKLNAMSKYMPKYALSWYLTTNEWAGWVRAVKTKARRIGQSHVSPACTQSCHWLPHLSWKLKFKNGVVQKGVTCARLPWTRVWHPKFLMRMHTDMNYNCWHLVMPSCWGDWVTVCSINLIDLFILSK